MDDLFLIHILTGFLPVIVVVLGMRILKEDSFPDSRLFIVDQARTLRFAISYFIFLELTILGLGASVLFILLGLIIIIGLIVWLIINLFVGILLFVGAILNTVEPNLISLDSFIESTGISRIDDPIETVITTVWLTIVITSFVLITPVYVGKQIGKYLEDFKAVKLLALIITLLETSIILYFISVSQNQDIANAVTAFSFAPLISFIFIRFTILIRFASSNYNAKQEEDFYDLQDIVKLRRSIILGFGLIGIVLIALAMYEPLFNDSVIVRDINSDNALFARLMTFSFAVIQILLVFPVLFFFHGDYPLSFKIEELEQREDLRKHAEEFRKLDKDNIEEFSRKNVTRL